MRLRNSWALSFMKKSRVGGAPPPAPGAWEPDNLAVPPAAWYDADALTGADGSNVSPWTDRGANGHNAVLAAGAAPILRYASLNGRKTVEFTGSTGAAKLDITTGLLNSSATGSFYAVFQIVADPPAAGGNAGPVFQANAGGNVNSHHPWTDGNFYEAFGAASGTERKIANPAPLFTTARIYNCDSWTEYRARIDGTVFITDATHTTGFGTVTRNLGYNPVPSYLSGKIAEIVVFNYVLTQAEREQVEGYLAHKWFGAGASNNLPAGHPYKDTAP